MTLLVGLFTMQTYALSTATVGNGTGGAAGTYATLKLAFDDINNGVLTGAITLQLTSGTTEAATASLNASGGSANYSSVKIYPTVSGLTINGSVSGSVITFNGADNVTIDGSVGGNGSTRDLIITNAYTTTLTSNNTIPFTADAQSNTIKYCTIKGSGTSATTGTIAFTTSVSGVGNGSNTLSNNLITNANNTKRPTYSIYSQGTAVSNSSNTTSNNEFGNYTGLSVASSAIYLGSVNTTWTISGNSFYDSNSPFTSTNSSVYKAIEILGGTGYTISGNYIGGSSKTCGGTWTKSNSTTNTFIGIALTLTAGGTKSTVTSNIIKNITWGNSGNQSFTVISAAGGDIDITSNIIGANLEPISYTTGTTGGFFKAVDITSTGTILCQSNYIGYITGANSDATAATNFQTINISSAATGSLTVSDNIIHNITASSASSGTRMPKHFMVFIIRGQVRILLP